MKHLFEDHGDGKGGTTPGWQANVCSNMCVLGEELKPRKGTLCVDNSGKNALGVMRNPSVSIANSVPHIAAVPSRRRMRRSAGPLSGSIPAC